MNNGEIVDILDPNGNVIGSATREEAERDNLPTQNALVFLFNSLGRVWTQLRPKVKKQYGGLWDISVCEGVSAGESADAAASRGVKEETGLENIKLHFVDKFINTFPGESGEERRRLSCLYIGFTDQIPIADKIEVDDFQDWAPADLRAHAVNHPHIYVPSLVFELDKATEAYKNLVQ